MVRTVLQLHTTRNMIHSTICTVPVPSIRILSMRLLIKLIDRHCLQVNISSFLSVVSFNSAITGAPSIGWNIPTKATPAGITQLDTQHPAPPLPPRNTTEQYANVQQLDRRKVFTKLYENVVVRKTYDPELVAFYGMVKQLRSQYKHNDTATNVGHIVAAEFSNRYPDKTSIKLLVHPSLTCLNDERKRISVRSDSGESGAINVNNSNDKGQVDGYGPPFAFTCDSKLFCELSLFLLKSSHIIL